MKQNKIKIPFNKPTLSGNEIVNLRKVMRNRKFSFPGEFSRKCSEFLKNKLHTDKAIMTSSCSGALEIAAQICDFQPEDEVIIPSFSYVSTASAFAERKVKIVWCEIREDTKNIDETKIESLITAKTKAVVAVHYGGISSRKFHAFLLSFGQCRNDTHVPFRNEIIAKTVSCNIASSKNAHFTLIFSNVTLKN